MVLFRFVDVLPSLDSAAKIGPHLREYFARIDHALHAGWLVAPVVRHNVVQLARRFIVEEDNDALTSVLEGLRQEPAAFTLDVVGGTTVSDREAEAMQRCYSIFYAASRRRQTVRIPSYKSFLDHPPI